MNGNFMCMGIVLFSQAVLAQETLDKKPVAGINTRKQIEFSPTISADGRTLIYETQQDDKWELYQSHLDDQGNWSAPAALSAINDNCQFIAGPSLSYDGNTLYYTAFIDNVTETEDIFYSTRLSDRQWSEPKSIGAPVNTVEYYEGFPSIAADGNSLYFIRQTDNIKDRKSKEICFSIFVAHKQQDGSWSEPEILPQPINTGCERDPRIMADNHTLIFSSIREEGKGKYDLYQSRLLTDGSWDEPVPLDFVNSDQNDQSPCISAAGDIMYYYSNEDIYQVTIPVTLRQFINITLSGIVTAGNDRKPVKGVIFVRNTKSGESFVTNSNENDGRFSIVFSAGQSYEVTFSNLLYRSETLMLDYTKEETYREETKNINLSSDWPLPLQVEDKEIHEPIPAWVMLKANNGDVIFNDSITSQDYPESLPLQTNVTYLLSISAKNYPAFEQELKFVRQSFNEDSAYVVSLMHDKVPIVTDVTESISGQKKRVKVSYYNTTHNEVIIASAGEVVNLRKGDRYQVMTNSEKGFSYAMRTITAGEEGDSTETSKVSLSIVPLVIGARLTLNNIYFQTNSSKLSEASMLELETLIELLKQNPGIMIEISAHTDDIGTDEYNDNLSFQRATSVTQFLSRKGASAKQLVAKGYGKRQPVVPNDSDENRAKNRRVELLVLAVQ